MANRGTINKSYERKRICKLTKKEQSNKTLATNIQQGLLVEENHTRLHNINIDIDMQLEDVSHEWGGSSH